jgi:hypothetical protein
MVAVTTLSFAASVAIADAIDMDKLPMEKCSTVQYGKSFLEAYPKSPAACIEVRVYDGQRYMKVLGKVYISDKDSVTVSFLNPLGDTLGALTFKSSNSPTVIFNDKLVPFASLQAGEKVTFWVPESIFAAK